MRAALAAGLLLVVAGCQAPVRPPEPTPGATAPGLDEGTTTVLDILYGQMTESAAAGRLDAALATSATILGVAPGGYRDVRAKREQYLERLYAAGSASLRDRDLPQAVKLLGQLVAAERGYKDGDEKLREAQAARRRPLPGAYAVDRGVREGDWEVRVTSVIVQPDERATVAAVWRNAASAERAAVCDPSPVLTVADGTRVMPLERACSVPAGELIAPGGSFSSSATYPPLGDWTAPFSVTWADLGTVDGIVILTPAK